MTESVNYLEIYCPRCFGGNVSISFTFEGHDWECHDCGQHWDWEFSTELMDWPWVEKTGSLPNPGCPWCGTRQIKVSADGGFWLCRRWSCEKYWRGTYTTWRSTDDGTTHYRWKIQVPVRDVPFTWIDAEGVPVARWLPRNHVHS